MALYHRRCCNNADWYHGFFVLPGFPRSGEKSWLTEQERRYAEFRLTASVNNQVDELGTVKEALKDAVTDPKVLALVLVNVCFLSSQTWTSFFPSIVKTLGYGTVATLLLTSLVYVFGGILSDRQQPKNLDPKSQV